MTRKQQTMNPMKKLVAVMVAYEKIIAEIVKLRPDLEAGEVKGHISHLAESPLHNHYQWAESCRTRAQRGEPMPWEPRPDT